MAAVNFADKTAYHSVAALDTDQISDPSQKPVRPSLGPSRKSSGLLEAIGRRSWWKTFIVQVLAVGWLVPIIYLLYVNIAGHLIGASAWCPKGNCDSNKFAVTKDSGQWTSNLGKYDKEDHNLLGGLQLVAKALEIWFMLVAAALVYLITMWLASQPDGLPISYIFRSTEFGEVTGLLDPLLWTSLRARAGKPAIKPRVYLYIAFTVFLCIICNLMGPAVAVLLIPALQWIKSSDTNTNVTFDSWNTGSAPAVGNWAFTDVNNYAEFCTEDQFTIHNYSCSAPLWQTQLDALVADYWASQDVAAVVTQQRGVTFQFNQTFRTDADGYLADVVYFAPNRQALTSLDKDQKYTYLIGLGVPQQNISQYNIDPYNWDLDPSQYDTFAEYNKSLELSLERVGPILGATPNLNIDYNGNFNLYVQIDSTRALKCYKWYSTYYTPLARGSSSSTTTSGNYTKCVTYGTGWSAINDVANFTISNVDGGSDVFIEAFSSDRAAFLPNGTLPAGFDGRCLEYAAVPSNLSCNWDALFAPSTMDPNVKNRTNGITTIEVSMVVGKKWVTFGIDFVAYANFTAYTLDPYYSSNPLLLTSTQNLPQNGEPIIVNPNWILAAWGADANGAVPGDGTAAVQMVSIMQNFWNEQNVDLDNYTRSDQAQMDRMAWLTVMHPLSLVDYKTATITPGAKTDVDHPVLARWGRMYVWAYKLSSRTGMLGAAVAIIGCFIVSAQFIIGIISRKEYRSPTQILVSALEHERTDAFVEAGASEKEIARTPFRVRELRYLRSASTLEFLPPAYQEHSPTAPGGYMMPQAQQSGDGSAGYGMGQPHVQHADPYDPHSVGQPHVQQDGQYSPYNGSQAHVAPPVPSYGTPEIRY